jgi:hypothetical protein
MKRANEKHLRLQKKGRLKNANTQEHKGNSRTAKQRKIDFDSAVNGTKRLLTQTVAYLSFHRPTLQYKAVQWLRISKHQISLIGSKANRLYWIVLHFS